MSEQIKAWALKGPSGHLYVTRINTNPDNCFVFGDAPREQMLKAGYSVVPVVVTEMES